MAVDSDAAQQILADLIDSGFPYSCFSLTRMCINTSKHSDLMFGFFVFYFYFLNLSLFLSQCSFLGLLMVSRFF